MTRTELVEKMKALAHKAKHGDTEGAHQEADKIMCDILRQIGYGDAVDIFEAMKKWYG